MDRWTERFNNYGEKAIAIHDGSDFPNVCFEGEREYDVMDALAEYEDLEEQGLLLKLPCKVGDTVFDIFDNSVRENSITSIEFCKNRKYCIWAKKDEMLGTLNEDVFLTREEAEKKLEEMKKC